MCKSAEAPVCESHVPFGATIRYLLIAVHRRGLVQSLIGLILSDGRVWE